MGEAGKIAIEGHFAGGHGSQGRQLDINERAEREPVKSRSIVSLPLAARLTLFVIDSVHSHVARAEKGNRVGKGPGHDFRRALVSWAVRVIRRLDARRTSQPE